MIINEIFGQLLANLKNFVYKLCIRRFEFNSLDTTKLLKISDMHNFLVILIYEINSANGYIHRRNYRKVAFCGYMFEGIAHILTHLTDVATGNFFLVGFEDGEQIVGG